MPVTLFSRLLNAAHSAVPSQCALCRTWGIQPLCSDCTARFTVRVTRCRTCATQLPGTVDQPDATSSAGRQCGQCLLNPSALHACWAGVSYDYPWDALLKQLKYQGRHGAGPDPAVARLLASAMPRDADLHRFVQRADWIVPVPLSAQRLRQRGFNQALEISKYWLAGNPALAKLQPALLLRTRDTASQTGLARSERLLNLRHAFAVDPAFAPQVQGAHIVLLDDVTTTTATLNTAAQALRSAGAAQVVGVVLARTPAPDEDDSEPHS